MNSEAACRRVVALVSAVQLARLVFGDRSALTSLRKEVENGKDESCRRFVVSSLLPDIMSVLCSCSMRVASSPMPTLLLGAIKPSTPGVQLDLEAGGRALLDIHGLTTILFRFIQSTFLGRQKPLRRQTTQEPRTQFPRLISLRYSLMAVELPDSDESSTADDDCVDGDFFSLWRLCGCCVSVPQSGPFDSLVGDLNRAFKVKEPEDAIGTLETFRDALLQPLTDPLPPWNGAVQPGGHPSAMVGYQQKRLMLTPLSFRSAIPSIIDIFREFRSSDDLDAAHVRRTFAEFSHRFLDEAGWLEIAEAFSQHTDGIWVGALGMSFYRLILARLSSMTTREETVVYNADEVIDVNETQVNETLLEMPLAHLFVLLLENYNGTAEQQLEVEALLKNREERYQSSITSLTNSLIESQTSQARTEQYLQMTKERFDETVTELERSASTDVNLSFRRHIQEVELLKCEKAALEEEVELLTHRGYERTMPDIKDKGLNPMLTVNPSSLLTLLPAQWSVSSQPSTSLPADEVVKPELKAARFKVDIEPSEAPPTEDQNEFPFNAFPEARGHSAVSDPFRVLINVQHPNPSRPVLTADLMEYLYFPCTTLPAYLAKTAQNLLHEARSTPDLSLASQQRSAERQSIPITWATAAALTDITAMGHSQLPSPVPYFLVLSGGEWFFITFQNGTKNRDRSEHFFAVACEICHCPSNPNLVPIVQLNFSQADVAAVIAPAVTPLLLVYFKHQPPLLIHLSPHSSSWLGRDSFLRSLMNSVPSDASGGFALHPVLRTSTSRFCLGPGLHAFATWNDSFILVNGDVPLMLQPSPAFLVPCLVALGPSDWVDDRTVYRKQLASKSRPVDPKRVCVWERGMVGFQGRHLIFGRDVDSVVRLSLDALQLLQNFSLNLGTAVGSHRRHLHCIAAEFNTKIVFGWESQSVQQAMSSLLSSHKMAITTFEDAETRFRDSLLRKLHSQLLS